MDKTENKVYRELIGRCAEADGGSVEAKVGDIKTIIGAIADALFDDDVASAQSTLDMLLVLGKQRAKKRKK